MENISQTLITSSTSPSTVSSEPTARLDQIVEVLECRLEAVVEDVLGDADFTRLARGVGSLLTLERIGEHRRAVREKVEAKGKARFMRLSDMPPLHPDDVERMTRDALALRARERPESVTGSLAETLRKINGVGALGGIGAVANDMAAGNDRGAVEAPAPDRTVPERTAPDKIATSSDTHETAEGEEPDECQETESERLDADPGVREATDRMGRAVAGTVGDDASEPKAPP